MQAIFTCEGFLICTATQKTLPSEFKMYANLYMYHYIMIYMTNIPLVSSAIWSNKNVT